MDCSHGLSLASISLSRWFVIVRTAACAISLWTAATYARLRRISGDYALVSELEGRATILDRDHVPVAFIGDNPRKEQWANYDLDPGAIKAAEFSAAPSADIMRGPPLRGLRLRFASDRSCRSDQNSSAADQSLGAKDRDPDQSFCLCHFRTSGVITISTFGSVDSIVSNLVAASQFIVAPFTDAGVP